MAEDEPTKWTDARWQRELQRIADSHSGRLLHLPYGIEIKLRNGANVVVRAAAKRSWLELDSIRDRVRAAAREPTND